MEGSKIPKKLKKKKKTDRMKKEISDDLLLSSTHARFVDSILNLTFMGSNVFLHFENRLDSSVPLRQNIAISPSVALNKLPTISTNFRNSHRLFFCFGKCHFRNVLVRR